MQQFRGGLVFKEHRLVYHSTLGLRVIRKKEDLDWEVGDLVAADRELAHAHQ